MLIKSLHAKRQIDGDEMDQEYIAMIVVFVMGIFIGFFIGLYVGLTKK